ncbi:hypothetical protein VCRA2119O54_30257 [Vibrio crassostreae]|nr:hypothetical protein VCRA2119O45_30257 [Vibrio crassostreae]CAK2367549.1 hypothetical protein VCRA2119O49_40060 [Vibrio crassostreae]CAK2507452.1 hypothetical protein VCRA2119O54_30257 [Vibrio crassostreae]CAK3014282.1 hypothetical protein VCRA2123O75_40258 [Vibrio crassostreae]CAK3356813.1 hypothetical protein VCRA2120O62_210060 [Vibrio crassostreae]
MMRLFLKPKSNRLNKNVLETKELHHKYFNTLLSKKDAKTYCQSMLSYFTKTFLMDPCLIDRS